MLRARGRSVATVWVPAAVSGIEDSLREMRAAPKEPSVVSRGSLTASFAIRNPRRVTGCVKIARLSSFSTLRQFYGKAAIGSGGTAVAQTMGVRCSRSGSER